MSFIYSMLDTWNNVATTFNGIYMDISNGAGGAPVGAAASRAIRLDANSVSIFDVDISGNTYISGNLGLGVATAGAKLDVRGAVIFNEAGGDFDVRMEGDTDANLFFLDASTDRIGISTTSPSDLLDVRNGRIGVSGIAETGGFRFYDAARTGFATFGYAEARDVLQMSRGLEPSSDNALDLGNTTNFWRNGYFKGSVGIGIDPTSQLHTTGTVRFANFGAGAATFDASGNVSSVSDERYKNIIGKFEEGLAELKLINPIIYKWNAESHLETEHLYAGFSAQNVNKAVKLATGMTPSGHLSLQDRALLAVAVNSIKELASRVEYLENGVV